MSFELMYDKITDSLLKYKNVILEGMTRIEESIDKWSIYSEDFAKKVEGRQIIKPGNLPNLNPEQIFPSVEPIQYTMNFKTEVSQYFSSGVIFKKCIQHTRLNYCDMLVGKYPLPKEGKFYFSLKIVDKGTNLYFGIINKKNYFKNSDPNEEAISYCVNTG